MIISKKHKYIFVGLPFSASSAISKELIEQYNGLSFLQKHSNIPILKNKISLKNYFVFGVYRNPIEICFSRFMKLKYNEKGIFTNSKFFKENGGHINLKTRKLRDRILDEDWTFDDYLNHQSKGLIPYDNYFSINKKYFSFVMNFGRLSSDFEVALKKCGIEPKRSLPVYNKTKLKKKTAPEISDKILNHYFAPFLIENREFHQMNIGLKPAYISQLLYSFLKPVRKIKIIYDDIRRNHGLDEYFSNLKEEEIYKV